MQKELVSEVVLKNDWRVVELPAFGETEARYTVLISSVISPAMVHLLEISLSGLNENDFTIDKLQVRIYENIYQALALTNSLQVPPGTEPSTLGGAYSLVLNNEYNRNPTKEELEGLFLLLYSIAERYTLGLEVMKLIVAGKLEEAASELEKHSNLEESSTTTLTH